MFDSHNERATRTMDSMVLGIICVFSLALGCSPTSPEAPKVGDQAPDFSLKNLGDERVMLKDLKRANFVMVNFWASWCAPCKAEVPFLNQIHEKYQGKELTVVGISVQENRDKVVAFSKKRSVQYPLLLDSDGSVAKRYGVISVPKTFILNKRGTVLVEHLGMIDDQTTMEIESIIGKPRLLN